MNLTLVEARSPLRATFVSGERTRAPPPEVHGSMRFKMKRRLSTNLVGTRFTASRSSRIKARTRWNASLPRFNVPGRSLESFLSSGGRRAKRFAMLRRD